MARTAANSAAHSPSVARTLSASSAAADSSEPMAIIVATACNPNPAWNRYPATTGASTRAAAAHADREAGACCAHMRRKDLGEQQIISCRSPALVNRPAIATVLDERRQGRAMPRPNQMTMADEPSSVTRVSAFKLTRVAISPKITTPVAPPTLAQVNTPAAALRRKAHVDDQFRHPLDDEVEAHDMREIAQSDEHRRRRSSPV